MADPNIPEIIEVWKNYLRGVDDWQILVVDIEPKTTGCGPVYDVIPNPIEGRPREGFAIADMREVEVAEPHYHIGDETMIYIVISGLGKTILGGEEHRLEPGEVVVIPSETGHFTIPQENLVLAVINTPPFNPDSVVQLKESNSQVGFDQTQFESYLQGKA